MTDLVQEYQSARQTKAARRAAKSSRYFTGTVSGVDGAGFATVVTPTAEIVCVVPDGLTVAVDDPVRVRVQGCDYLVAAVLVEPVVVAPERTDFTTSSPVGAGWYLLRTDGYREVYYGSTGNLAASTVMDVVNPLPEAFRPERITPIAAASGTSPRAAYSEIGTDGRWRLYNGQTSATTVYAHGIY